MANDKFLFVVSGAAGTGKDSVVKALREAHPEIEKTVSATTRAPRPGEQEGVADERAPRDALIADLTEAPAAGPRLERHGPGDDHPVREEQQQGRDGCESRQRQPRAEHRGREDDL